MSVDKLYHDGIRRIVEEDSRYVPDAYYFMQQAVTYTAERLNRRKKGDGEQHITGRELVAGIRDYALGQFGPMALDVFDEWGIRCTEDFGNIVFLMVSHQLLGASEDDTIDDFIDIYDFREAFEGSFRPQGKPVNVPLLDRAGE